MLVVGDSALMERARRRIEALERRWSRFLADSDVSRANRAAGHLVQVHPDTIVLATTALRAQVETIGAYDPLLGADLVGLGYDRTFAEIDQSPKSIPQHDRQVSHLVVEPDRDALTVPAGCALDVGGIGKGLAADLTIEDLESHGARGALVNLGGDIRVWGDAPTKDGWVVSVEHPLDAGAELVRVVLADGAVASTSRLRRTWGPPGASVHHLLDPASGRPAANGVAAVTVFAGTGWRAEAFTKAAFLAGPVGGVETLEANGLDGIVVTDTGVTRATASMAAISV